jgi:hypothetical protein
VRHFRVGASSCGETGSVGLSGRLEGHSILDLHLKRVARRALDVRKREFRPTGIRRAHEFGCPPPSCGKLGRLPDGGGLDVRAYKIGRLGGARRPDLSTVVKRVVGVRIALKPMGTVPLAVWQPRPPTATGSAAADVGHEER